MLRVRWFVFAITMAVFAARLHAADKPLEFLHALQEAGFGDTAVDYLKMLEKNNQVPPELNAVWDLEMSQSYMAGAKNAFDDKEAETFNAEATKYLDKFIKENPNHPEAAKAVLNSAIQAEQKGLGLLRAARQETNKEQAAANFAAAKAAFEESKPRFQQALDRFKEKLAALKPGAKGYEQAVADVLDGQLQVTLLDVYIARAYPDPKDTSRVKLLKAASAAFDKIYQDNRENVIGLAAHMWQGKAEDDLGNIDNALQIFDEVLVYGPDPSTATPQTVVEPIFADVEYEYLQLLRRKRKDTQLVTEAKEWLDAFKKNHKNVVLNSFQGIAFEYAKACDLAAQTAVGDKKRLLTNDAEAWLNIIRGNRSDFQREANDYWRKRSKNPDEEQDPKTTEEAFIFGQTALEAGNSDAAAKLFEKSLTLAPKNINSARVAEIKTYLTKARFNIARDFFGKKKFAECLAEAEKIVLDPNAGDIAPVAAAMSVQAAFNIYYEAAEPEAKENALARMNKIAAYLIATWPGRPEADDARMTVGKSNLVMGKVDEAINAFKSINIKSDKYPLGMYLAGYTYWNRYVTEKQKPEADRNQAQLTADRAAAAELIAKSLEAQKADLDTSKGWPKPVLDAQLQLAEIALEGEQFDQAVQLLQPLVDGYLAHKPDEFDRTVLRVFTDAVRAYSAKNDLGKAGEVGLKMVELGPDTAQVNGVLIDFTRLLDLERKKAAAEVTTSDSPGSRKKLDDTRKMLGDILGKLKDRTLLSPSSQVFIAEAFASINDNENATQQFDKLLALISKGDDAAKRLAVAEADFKKIENPTDEQTEAYQKLQEEIKRDQETGQALAKAKTRIQTQLVGLNRLKGDLPGALKAARGLVKDNPKALEPRLEECRILQAQADSSSDAKDFAEASAGWSKLRLLLEGTKPRPPEYYEVLYNAANCLVQEADKLKGKDKVGAAAKALSAEKVLNAALFSNRSLSGPDEVAKYQELAKKAAVLQGRSPAEKKP